MKTRYLYSIPFVALALAMTSCDVNKTSGGADSALVAQRAEKLGVVAMFPGDVSAVAAVYDIPGIVKSVTGLNIVQKQMKESGKAPQGQCQCPNYVVDAAVAIGPDVTAWLERIKDPVAQQEAARIQQIVDNYELMLAVDEGAATEEDVKKKMFVSGHEALFEMFALMDFKASQHNTAALTLAANLTPEGLEKARAALKDMKLPEEMALHGVVTLSDKTYNGIACKVFEVDGAKLSQKIQEKAVEKHDEATLARIKAGVKNLEGNKLYLAVGFVNNTLMSFVTTNPEKQVRVPASAEDSILGQAHFNMADSKLAHRGYGLLYMEPALVKALVVLDGARYAGTFSKAKEVLKKYGEQWNVANLEQNLAGVDSIAKNMADFYAKLDANAKELTLYSWQEQGLQMELAMTPGATTTKMDKVTTMNAVRPTENTVLYYSGCTDMAMSKMHRSMVGEVSHIVWDYATAYIANPNHEVSDNVRMGLPFVQMGLPALTGLWGAYNTMQSGLSGSEAIVIDLQGETSPALYNIPAPRMAFAYEVKDRAAIGAAWDQAKAAYGSVAPMIALATGGAGMAQATDAKSAVAGDVTVYDFGIAPQEGLNPIVAVSNNRWALAMPKSFGLDVLKQSTVAPADVAPMEFRLNLFPVRDALKQAQGLDQLRKVSEYLDAVTTDIKGISVTGKQVDGKDVIKVHVISAQ